VPASDGLRLVVIGPGRAGGALAIAATRAGHQVVGVLSRGPATEYGPALEWDEPLPEADIALVTVRDDAIGEVVDRLRGHMGAVAVAAHASGFTPISTLRPLLSDGVAIGGLHPLQTLPDPVRGAQALSGSYAAIDGDPLAVDALSHFAGSIGLIPFRLEDGSRPAYHAAAAASSNFVTTALALAADLFDSAAVDAAVARPLVEQVVANVFEGGPGSALTGPIARGDIETVIGHLTAARDVSPEVGRQFSLMAEATAIRAGREEDLQRWR
jgi:predicted short-subunit dehydrogenase-like oxidoreductase (DUF2520 family)